MQRFAAGIDQGGVVVDEFVVAHLGHHAAEFVGVPDIVLVARGDEVAGGQGESPRKVGCEAEVAVIG